MEALEHVARKHDNLLELVSNVSNEDPLAALRRVHVCGINWFGNILCAIPPESSVTLCAKWDASITEAFGFIQGLLVDMENTTYNLPIVAGGAGLSSLCRTTSASYLGAFFRVVGPLIGRLVHMGGPTTARAAALLADPLAAKRDQTWTTSVFAANHVALKLQASFIPGNSSPFV